MGWTERQAIARTIARDADARVAAAAAFLERGPRARTAGPQLGHAALAVRVIEHHVWRDCRVLGLMGRWRRSGSENGDHVEHER